MSAYVPFEIQVEILKRVPIVKSLLRFTSVSKQWKSLIHSSDFIIDHSVNQTQPHHLLVMHKVDSEYKYVSIVDDDRFPDHMFSPIVSPNVKLFSKALILDSSHGLVCLHGTGVHQQDKTRLIVLWNPSIRKSIGIAWPYNTFSVVGFGICPKTSDPKIISFATRDSKIPLDLTAMVFTLSSWAWRSVSINLSTLKESNGFSYNQVVVDGVIHWVAYTSGNRSDYRIISFDVTREEFGEVDLPDSLVRPRTGSLSISKLKESLAVLDQNEGTAQVCDVWMMIKNGDPKPSFTKLFTFSFEALEDPAFYIVIGFRKNGQPITSKCISRDGSQVATLEVHQPNNDLGTYEDYDSLLVMNNHGSHFEMSSYTESLLLLNHPDSYHW